MMNTSFMMVNDNHYHNANDNDIPSTAHFAYKH